MLTEEDISLIKDALSVFNRLLDKTSIGKRIKVAFGLIIKFMNYIVKKGIKALEAASKYADKAAIVFDIDEKNNPSIIDQAKQKIIDALS